MGKTMSTKARDKMKKLSDIPVLEENASLKKALDLMSEKRLGVACFVDKSGALKGLLTDGDLRRLLLTKQSPLPALLIANALSFGISKPSVAHENDDIDKLKELMSAKQIWDLPIIDSNNKLIGLLHRHDAN
jgi:DeoR family transcriptional regulator, catabolite repression regulator